MYRRPTRNNGGQKNYSETLVRPAGRFTNTRSTLLSKIVTMLVLGGCFALIYFQLIPRESSLLMEDMIDKIRPEEITNSHKITKTTCVHLRSQNGSPKVAAFEDYTKCMLQLEEYYQEFFPQYANAKQPFPTAVKIVDNHFYVIMSLFVTDDPDAWRQATYACNGINGKILDAVSEVAGQGLQLSSARKG